MKRHTKETWLKEGLKVLAELGNAGLTIEEMTTRLKVTKGSFYHHFKNRKSFSSELLSYWEGQMTKDIIQISKKGASFEERNRLLFETSNKTRNCKLEVAIRAWALRDEMVREFQERVDRQRITYLKEIYEMGVGDKKAAKELALIRYAFTVGAQQVIPSIKGKELSNLFYTLHKFFAEGQ
jgi:AcrR family transcriptional regulator